MDTNSTLAPNFILFCYYCNPESIINFFITEEDIKAFEIAFIKLGFSKIEAELMSKNHHNFFRKQTLEFLSPLSEKERIDYVTIISKLSFMEEYSTTLYQLQKLFNKRRIYFEVLKEV